MSTPPITYGPLDYGMVGFALLVAWKVIDFAKAMLLKRSGIQDDHAPKLYMPCQMDPTYSQKQHEVYDMVKKMRDSQAATDERIVGGQFDCPWHSRDEVRDLMEIQRQLVTELRNLTSELKLTRNGGKI